MDYEETVTIDLGDGKNIECGVMFVFEAGNEDQEYIAVTPLDGDDDSEVYFYRYKEDENGEPSLENIESDQEYEMVVDRFEECLDEQEYNDSVAQGGSEDEF